MTNQFILASVVFVATYALIIAEKIHRTTVALAGGMLVIFLGLIHQADAVKAIDFNTLGLLVGMMIIVGITRRTGVFEYLAIKSAKAAKGEPWRILLFLGLITAGASALLDNVTAVLLVVPVTFAITDKLGVNPIPYLITEILTSNIGGTATLIGDPPNIMIGSATGLGFMDFIYNMTLPALIILVVNMLVLKLIYGKHLTVAAETRQVIMALDENEQIKDQALLRKSLAVLILTILGFVLHQVLHLESATVALGGATLLLLLTREEPEDVLLTVEWPTIFFFVGLFILVGALEHAGVITWIAQKSLELTGGALVPTALLIIWLSALASAFVDNIPFVATMIPLIQTMGQLGGISDLNPLWWSLALGACLGGNGSLVGASANLIVAGLAEKYGTPISFRQFFKIGFPLMLLSVAVATVYVYIAYLM